MIGRTSGASRFIIDKFFLGIGVANMEKLIG